MCGIASFLFFVHFRPAAASPTGDGGEGSGADSHPGKATRQRDGNPAGAGRRGTAGPDVADRYFVLCVKVTQMRSPGQGHGFHVGICNYQFISPSDFSNSEGPLISPFFSICIARCVLENHAHGVCWRREVMDRRRKKKRILFLDGHERGIRSDIRVSCQLSGSHEKAVKIVIL